MAGVPLKRSRGFTEVGLDVSQDHDTAARKQNKILPIIGHHGLTAPCMGQASWSISHILWEKNNKPECLLLGNQDRRSLEVKSCEELLGENGHF